MNRPFSSALLTAALLFFILLALPAPGHTTESEVSIKIIKIAAEENSAVVQKANGSMMLVHVGDQLAPYGKVTAISANRIVFKSDMAEVIIVKLEKGVQRTQRIGKVGLKDAAHQSPVYRVISNTKASNGGAMEVGSPKKK
jgi:hypothetical protein